MAEIISGIYKIINTVTGDFYIGSSKNVNRRWACHKCLSTWNECPNNPMYIDMQKYGVDKFAFEILEEVEIESLKETEQKFIEKMHPTYNSNNSNGLDFERKNKYNKEYYSQFCYYNGEVITLAALKMRFKRAGVEHPVKEAKNYLLTNYKDK